MLTITMAGPGGTMDYDIELLIDTLATLGYKAEVNRNYQQHTKPWNDVNTTREDWLAGHHINRQKWLAKYQKEPVPAQINVTEIPWGG